MPARAVWRGQSLDRAYERAWFQHAAEEAGLPVLGSFVPQPPANALLLLPLARLSPLRAKAAWTLVLAAALGAALLSLRGVVPISTALLVLVFLLPGASLRNALLYGQPYPLLLLLLCLSLRAAVRDRPAWSGLCLSPVIMLKLYGLPFVLYLAWRRQWRALLGALAGAALITLASVALLGREVHEAYVREVLPASMTGRVQDPYSTIWQSATSLSYRLWQREADLNPEPVADRPALARGLAVAVPAALALAAILAAAAEAPTRAFAILVAASLAASPLTSTYHFVQLVLPVAVLAADREASLLRRVSVVLLFVFATSPLPHYFSRFAAGWGNLLAYPRLAAVTAILLVAMGGALTWRRAGLAMAGAALLGGVAALRTPPEERWERVAQARGYLAADPQPCPGGLGWISVAGDRLARVWSGGPCPDREVPAGLPESVRRAWELGDADAAGTIAVFVDEHGDLRERGASGERTLLAGPARHPRLSPDGAWVAVQVWRGSWDVLAVRLASGETRALTHDAAGEMEPAWEADGRGVVFASDRRRGLGSTALYRVPFLRD